MKCLFLHRLTLLLLGIAADNSSSSLLGTSSTSTGTSSTAQTNNKQQQEQQQARRRALQESCTISEDEQPKEWKGFWILELQVGLGLGLGLGPESVLTVLQEPEQSEGLERAIEAAFDCQSTPFDGGGGGAAANNFPSYLRLTNVTILWKEQDQDQDQEGDEQDAAVSNSDEAARTVILSLPVHVEGITNLIEFDGEGPIFFQESEEGENERRHLLSTSSTTTATTRSTLRQSRGLQKDEDDNNDVLCLCSNPSKSTFLEILAARLRLNFSLSNFIIKRVQNIYETEEIQDYDACQEAQETTFSANLALDIRGNYEGFPQGTLDDLVRSILRTYNGYGNNANSIMASCDVESKSLVSGRATIDASSIPVGEGTSEEQSEGGGAVRFLQNINSSTTTRSPNTTLAPTTPNSSFANAMFTYGPTQSPTTRGPDLFTILLQLQGACTGCAANADLFNQVSDGTPRNTDDDANEDANTNEDANGQDGGNNNNNNNSRRRLQDLPTATTTTNAGIGVGIGDGPGSTNSILADSCRCVIGSEPGFGWAEQEFLQELQRQLVDSTSNISSFVVEFTRIEQVVLFDCPFAATPALFDTFLTLELEGDFESFQSSEESQNLTSQLLMTQYNLMASESCDPFVKQVASIAQLQLVPIRLSESPSQVPSLSPTSSMAPTKPSSAPSNAVDGRPLIRKRDVGSGGSSSGSTEAMNDRFLQVGIMEPSTLPSSSNAPSSSHAPSTNPSTTSSSPTAPASATTGLPETSGPTQSPTTRGPDLFFLVFALTGTCNGCDINSGLFDDLSTRKRHRNLLTTSSSSTTSSLAPPPGMTRLRILQQDEEEEDQEFEGKCACSKDAPIGGVNQEDFFEIYTERIEELESIDSVGTVLEQPEAPETSPPTTSQNPSSEPSIRPSERPTTREETLFNSSASVSPSQVPSTFPSALPSELPSQVPSTFPSHVPSAFPSQVPSAFPSQVPSTFPSELPSELPSQFPSTFPSQFPSAFPSQVPSAFPSQVPSAFPSEIPSAFPSGNPSQRPLILQSGNPSQNPSVSALPSGNPSEFPSVLPSGNPSGNPSQFPTVLPSGNPSQNPSQFPSALPSGNPSGNPSQFPSVLPSGNPSGNPSQFPTVLPSGNPSQPPSSLPSGNPSQSPSPSTLPSSSPSALPSADPSLQPSGLPSMQPAVSVSPSGNPSQFPSVLPSGSPSQFPSVLPSRNPSQNPSQFPSALPSSPSTLPSSSPSALPSAEPSLQPSGLPSMQPSTCEHVLEITSKAELTNGLTRVVISATIVSIDSEPCDFEEPPGSTTYEKYLYTGPADLFRNALFETLLEAELNDWCCEGATIYVFTCDGTCQSRFTTDCFANGVSSTSKESVQYLVYVVVPDSAVCRRALSDTLSSQPGPNPIPD